MLDNLKEFYMAVFYQKKCQQNDNCRVELSSGCKNDTSDNIEKKGSP